MNQGLVSTNQFIEAFQPHYDDALRFCRALCARWSPADAEDVLQQALLQALKHYSALKDPSKFRPWLFQIITRTFHSSVRKYFWKKFLPVENVTDFPEMPEVYYRAEANENKLILREALSKLSAKERAAILLFEIAGFSIEEIASIQNEKSLSTVKSRLSRARKRLKAYIVNRENQPLKLKNRSSSKMIGDIDHETLKLVAEIKVKGRVE